MEFGDKLTSLPKKMLKSIHGLFRLYVLHSYFGALLYYQCIVPYETHTALKAGWIIHWSVRSTDTGV